MQYGSFGEDGMSDALADLNDAFGELDGFGEVAKGTLPFAIPVVVGMATTFGAVAALDYFIDDPTTKASLKPYVWLIGAGVGTVAGIIMWKVPSLGPSYGIIAISAAITLALLNYLGGYLAEQKAVAGVGRFRAYTVTSPQPVYGRFGRYEVERPQAVYQGVRGLGEGQMVNLGGMGSMGEGTMVNLGGGGRSSVLRGAINPGVFG